MSTQTYVFTVVVQGDDVQDAAEQLREDVIDAIPQGVEAHVTESVRAFN